MTKKSPIPDGSLYFQHFSFRTGYRLDYKKDFCVIEDKYNILLDTVYKPIRTISGINQWVCPECGETMKKSYKDIVYNGLKCSSKDCDNGSNEGMEDRKWHAKYFECIECGEEHTFAILCGHHYAKAHRKDPNIIAHNYRRETRRMVIASGWKPSKPLESLLYPCHICKQDNTTVKMVKSHWEWNHSDIDIEQFTIDFLVSIGVPRKKCRWCGEHTSTSVGRIGFRQFHTACKSTNQKDKTIAVVGRRNNDGEPIDEDGNVTTEDNLKYY